MSRHARRFFVDDLGGPGARLRLPDDEAHHLLNVIRVRVGEDVILLDGSGREARAVRLDARRGEALLEIRDIAVVNREPVRALTLAAAMPRAARMDFLVEKCCELGVARLIPVVTRYGVADPSAHPDHHLRRWRRIVIEAAKQSGRTRLTEITPVIPLGGALREAGDDAARVIVSPETDAEPVGPWAHGLDPRRPVFALIGPEGGFSPEELDRARAAGFRTIHLGPRILRVETAVVALAALLLLDT